MKLLSKILTLIWGLLLVACVAKNTLVDSSMFTAEWYLNRHATGFQILSLPDSSALLLRVERPVRRDMMILGEEHIADQEFEGAVIWGEAKRIVTICETPIALLDSMGEVERVVGVCGIDSISNTTVRRRYEEGRLLDVGRGGAVDFDAIVALHPDVVLLGGDTVGMGSIERLSELQIPYIYIDDIGEHSMVARMEWMVAISEIIGRGEDAVERFLRFEHRRDSMYHLILEMIREDSIMSSEVNRLK